MTVVLPRGLEKKISDLKKIKGEGWDKELEKAIDAILAEDLLLTPNPKQKLTEAQAIKEASKAVKQYRAQTKREKST
ncbi:hypothetical protein Mesil_1736 [Allomeiothermus silvanus DSM 9946]|uniref:Uncharacterized protein n=1 Tax=Allomeiothermus silvanus (strain ATCC 700542 / DSM 9946 / NBRC 106475 / NCIMB 13440 / VI-R2) TaxID=526227 RepID=D7BFR3_ALLS1|nr:hypothetical protein [Allomeiothermus silvanus]ADH63616.1 hypothetical protein Mesil_1736 [Allomeiothermus silvanus DSM 9946]